MMSEIVSGHMVKWLCCGVASIASAMCPRSWDKTCNFSRSPPDIRHEPMKVCIQLDRLDDMYAGTGGSNGGIFP